MIWMPPILSAQIVAFHLFDIAETVELVLELVLILLGVMN